MGQIQRVLVVGLRVVKSRATRACVMRVCFLRVCFLRVCFLRVFVHAPRCTTVTPSTPATREASDTAPISRM